MRTFGITSQLNSWYWNFWAYGWDENWPFEEIPYEDDRSFWLLANTFLADEIDMALTGALGEELG